MSPKSFEKLGIFENFVGFFREEGGGGVNDKLRDFFQEPLMTPAMVFQNMWKFEPSPHRNVSSEALLDAQIEAVRSIQVCIYIYIYISIYTYIYLCVCVCVCVCECIYVCMYVFHLSIHLPIYIYTYIYMFSAYTNKQA